MKKTLSLNEQNQALQAQNAQLQRLLEQMEKRVEEHSQHLQQNIASLQEKDEIIRKNNEFIQSQKIEIDYLKERLSILLSKRFQSQSEQLKHLQFQLFDEAELERAIQETQQAIEALEESHAPKETTPADSVKGAEPSQEKPKRKALPERLRRVEIIVDVSDEDKQAMGDEWVEIGFESSEQLAVNPREYFVKVIKRKKYVRKAPVQTPESEPSQAGILVAPPAKVMLPRSIADASLLADVLCSKYIDAMSFYRTEQRLQREGIDIGYSTICDWPLQLYERLKPFENLFYEALGRSPLWHLDETTLQVLDEAGRENQQTSYLWGIRAGPPEDPIVLFHYNPRRNFEALEQWLRPCLEEFTGVIVTDEHAPYNALVNKYTTIKAHGGCLAHMRRKFADAGKGRRHQSDAHKVLQKIALVYSHEKRTARLSGEARVDARQQLVKPQLDGLKNLLEAMAPKYLSKGAMKTAIGYALNNWPKFTAFLDHPEMPIDNNPMEQAIRPFTIGRRNWLFAGSPRGADASAFIYSLIETAKANGLEPWGYLNALFEAYPHASNDDERRKLLPWVFKNKA